MILILGEVFPADFGTRLCNNGDTNWANLVLQNRWGLGGKFEKKRKQRVKKQKSNLEA